MIKKLIFIIFIISSLNGSSKYILLLHSYNKGLVWSDNISKGIEDSLKNLPNYELSTEYLDTKRNKNTKYYKLIRQAFIQKFKKQGYDIVIAADNAAVEFVLENKENLFKNTPIVFTGIEEMAPGINIERVLKQNISLIIEHKPLKSNIEMILKLMPKLKYLYVINDKTNTSLMINEILKNTLDTYKEKFNYKLYLDGNISDIYKDFNSLPTNSAVWFGNLYLDENEEYIPFYKVSKLLNSSKVPVFAMTDYHLGKGIIGGHLLRGYYVGYEAGKRAFDILEAKEIDYSKPIFAKTEWVFDYEILNKFNIKESLLHKDTILINQPKSFFEKYRYWIDRIFITSPFILFFLLIALLNIYKRHKLSKQLISQNKREQVLLNTIKSTIFWIDTKGLIRGYNQSFCENFFEGGEDALGKNISDVFKNSCQLLTYENLSLAQDIEFVYKSNNYIAYSRTYYDEIQKTAVRLQL